MKDPVLKPSIDIDGGKQRLVVKGGLHYIRGNRAPYFSVTCDIYENGRDVGGGAAHELILREHPDLADIIALHLSDMDGAPGHDAPNAWYWLAGAYEHHMGEEYHGGNSKQNFPCTPPADKPWSNTEHRYPTLDESLAIFARHVRISIEEARTVRDLVGAELGPQQEDAGAPRWRKADFQRARAVLKKWIEQQRPRWKAEADAVIAKYKLVPYGDTWKAA